MFTADAHCDTLYERAVHGKKEAECCVTYERMEKGNDCLQTFAVFSSMEREDPCADGAAMLKLYKTLPLNHLDGKLPDEPPRTCSCAVSLEGGEILKGSLDVLRAFDDDVHLRLIALTWNYENEIGQAAMVNETDGLKPFGFELLREMDRRGICADVSHLNIRGFWDVIEHAECPPVASHSDARVFCDVPRNLWDDQIRALIDRKGFIGINFLPEFLVRPLIASPDDVLRHIDHICELGGEDVVGFGSDFDGIDSWPEGIASPADFPYLLSLLKDHGYTDLQLQKIAGLNYWRVLKTAEAMRV